MTSQPLTAWLLGPCTGALMGFLWWSLYSPSAYSLWALATSHAVAGVAVQLIAPLVSSRWRGTGSILLGIVGGLFLGPVLVVSPYTLGSLSGIQGGSIILVVMSTAGVLGLELGRRGWSGAVVLALIALGSISTNTWFLDERDEKADFVSVREVDSFPDASIAVIGIDGADFSIAKPMIERGELPHLAGLMARGQHGVLRSLKPTLSPVAWTTIFSGHPAEVHGLHSWATSDNRNRRVPMLWDIFGIHGNSSLVVNVPGTWPPAPIENGTILAGFPIPSIISGGRGQLLGSIVSSVPDEQGAVTTERAHADSQGRFRFDIAIATPHVQPKLAGVTHPLIDGLAQDGLMLMTSERLIAQASLAHGSVELISDALDAPVVLPVGTWSDWLRVKLSDGHVYLRAHVLEAAAGRFRMYLTPAFQDPEQARYPFSLGSTGSALAELGSPYIVEGVGWRLHLDPRVSALLPEILSDVEQVHAEAALALIEEHTPALFAYVITLTDRIQHPFWRLHDPSAFGPDSNPHPGLEGRDPIEEAYRVSDELLGKMLAALPEDSLVFVLSDHGAAPLVEKNEGTHRMEGIWIAAGPDVAHDPEPHELSILDLVPTVLQCIGAPVADDMPGSPSTSICPAEDIGPDSIASYTAEGFDRADSEASREVQIDASREEQLRSLGYIE
jgi:hypothetical protein